MQAHPLRITGKFPGYLSPSAGLKFADVPNGLAAISKAHFLFAFFLQEISQLGKGSVDAEQFKMFCQLVPSSCTLLFSQVRRFQFLMEVSPQEVRGMG